LPHYVCHSDPALTEPHPIRRPRYINHKIYATGAQGAQNSNCDQRNFSAFSQLYQHRLSLKEQIYIVVPAIIENAEQDFHNLENILERFKQYFPQHQVSGLHGQMKSMKKLKCLLISKVTK